MKPLLGKWSGEREHGQNTEPQQEVVQRVRNNEVDLPSTNQSGSS